jgi:acetoin:2,6-dichlorophenolindophenol oxidoreductase subunit alpha
VRRDDHGWPARDQSPARHVPPAVRAHEIYFEGLIKGTSHLALGQEAIAAGFASAMRPDDYTFCTYRGHNHVLSRGASMTAVYAELMGRAGGLMGGKGGSMHLTSVEHGALGSYAIVGAHLPIAAGAAWSAGAGRSQFASSGTGRRTSVPSTRP